MQAKHWQRGKLRDGVFNRGSDQSRTKKQTTVPIEKSFEYGTLVGRMRSCPPVANRRQGRVWQPTAGWQVRSAPQAPIPGPHRHSNVIFREHTYDLRLSCAERMRGVDEPMHPDLAEYGPV